MKSKAVIYARYSSSSQNEQSISTQIDICKKYANNNGYIVVNTYMDKGLTGTNANRPGFQRMIEDSYLNKFDAVIVYKFDRFARDEYDDIHYEKILNDNNVKRLSATEPIPEDYFSSRLIKAVTRLNNEQYSRVLSERVNAGLDKNVERGLMVGGSVTWGYNMVDKKYIINEHQATYVRTIFNMYADGSSANEIIDHLTSNGVFNANDKPFRLSHIMKILRNKRYIGIFTYKGVEHPNFIPPIIDPDLFNRVADRLSNAQNRRRHRSNVKFFLTGKLYCGMCNNKMVGSSGTSKSGKKHHYYICNHCSKKSENKKQLEDLVANIAIQQVVKSNHLDEWINEAIKVYNSSFDNSNIVIKNIRSQILKTKNEIENVMKAIRQGIITTSTRDELENLEEKQESLNIELAKKEAEQPIKLHPEDLKAWFKQARSKDSGEIIDALVKKVVVWDDKINVSFYLSNKSVLISSPQAHQIELNKNTIVSFNPYITITVKRPN